MRYAYKEPWKDFKDRHFVYGTAAWVLKAATVVNNAGYIFDNGLLNGDPTHRGTAT